MSGSLWSVFGYVLVALVVGSLARLIHLRRRGDDEAVRRRQSLATWWCLAVLVALSVGFSSTGVLVLLCLVSLLSMRELTTLIPIREADHGLIRFAYVAIVLSYLCLYLQWTIVFIVFSPVLVLLFICACGVLKAETRGFLKGVASLYLGVMLTGYCIAHGAALTTLPEGLDPNNGAVGWVLCLLLLTSVNDIAQSLWGKWLGRHQITPSVSPNKSWEGMAGGVITTILVSLLVGSALNAFGPSSAISTRVLADAPHLWRAATGALIGVGGFFGDITMSAIKRDMGVKDSGTMLPGQGGILDRVDSLTFTAPLFYWYLRALYGV